LTRHGGPSRPDPSSEGHAETPDTLCAGRLPSDRAAERREIAAIAASVGATLSDEQAASMQVYLDLLERWNVTYNLTAVRDRRAMLVQHLADCLAVLAPLARQAAGRSGVRILDVGSGGGLPGVVIAVARPEWEVCCVDAVGKKAAFVRQVAGQLRLPTLHALHARVETLRAAPFDVVTARAFATLGELVRLTGHLLAPAGVWMAMKGQVPDDELAGVPAGVEVFHVEPLTVPGLDARRCLVWMRHSAPPMAADAGPASASHPA
jgi:16S rRNA (guanine527-N7)-methyltransferase